MLHLKDLSINYNQALVLDGINYEFPNSGLFVILGNNGSGKTSLLKAICGLKAVQDKPKSVIVIAEQRINKMTLQEKASYVSYIDTPFPLPSFINLEEYVMLGYLADKEKAKNACLAMGMDEHFLKQVKNMSRGQQQKAMLSKLFYGDQPIWLLDEPTNYLDYPSVKNFWEQIALKAKEKLIIATVHNPEEALKLHATILIVKDKQLISFKGKPNLEELVSYLGV
jgi:ABC-type cobalamin/Fe3+-siderophores transport system ATPase subunit